MDLDTKNYPEDPVFLKGVIAEQSFEIEKLKEEIRLLQEKTEIEKLKKEIRILQEKQSSEIEKLKEENRLLQEKINILIANRFGPSSEKQTIELPGQFDEAEQDQENADSESEAEEPEIIEVPAHQRRKRKPKPKRKPLPDALPREDIIHDLPVEERVCAIDGSELVVVGQEVSEQLEIIPAQIKVNRNIRLKYGCPHCHKGIKTASMPPQPIPKSMAAPGLLAHIVTSKYNDSNSRSFKLFMVFARINMSA